MDEVEKEQLRMEIQHIFDSGANEIRIFEMVKSFIERRSGINKLIIANVVGQSEQLVCDHPKRQRDYYSAETFKCWKCKKIVVAN